MQEINPYQPPPIVEAWPAGTFAQTDMGGVWRQGNLLVVRKGAELPPRCVKTNLPAERYLKRQLSWASPWLALLIFLNLLIYLIVVLAVQKKATVKIGLTHAAYWRRMKHIGIAWGIALLAVGLFAAGIATIERAETVGGMLMSLSPLVLIASIVYGLLFSRAVWAKRIDDQFAWIKGVCPEYLDMLPEWTGPRY